MKKKFILTTAIIGAILLMLDFIYAMLVLESELFYINLIVVAGFAIILKIMTIADLALVKKGKGIIFRPPFMKDEQIADFQNFKVRRDVYIIFGMIVALLFYLTQTFDTLTSAVIVEILAIGVSMMAITAMLFESFLAKFQEYKHLQPQKEKQESWLEKMEKADAAKRKAKIDKQLAERDARRREREKQESEIIPPYEVLDVEEDKK